MAIDLKHNHPRLIAVWTGKGQVAIRAGYYLMAKLGIRFHWGRQSRVIGGSSCQLFAGATARRWAARPGDDRSLIVVDDRREHPHHLDEVVLAVEDQLGRLAKRVQVLVKFAGRDF